MQSPANLKLISRNLKIMFDAVRVLLLFAFFLFLFSTERISLLSWVKNYPFVGYYCLGKNEKKDQPTRYPNVVLSASMERIALISQM